MADLTGLSFLSFFSFFFFVPILYILVYTCQSQSPNSSHQGFQDHIIGKRLDHDCREEVTRISMLVCIRSMTQIWSIKKIK